MKNDFKEKLGFTLAEGATHVGISDNYRKSAFTLAEVLITLGIIGIVAAMTIPTLINNYKEKVRDNQFKKAYATLMQAYNASVAEHGYAPKCYYLVNGSNKNNTGCAELYEIMKSKLRITKSCNKYESYKKGCLLKKYEGYDDILKEQHKDDENYDPQEWDEYSNYNYSYFTTSKIQNEAPSFILNDGTAIFIFDALPYLAVDINGNNNGPNKFGYDTFAFVLKEYSNGAIRWGGPGPATPVSKGGVQTSALLQKLFGYK